jgi:hypothetical protein
MDWLMAGEPAIRWHTMRDLTNAAADEVAAERSRVAREGVGAAILARQDADGAWRSEGNPAWLTTLFTLQLLRMAGVDPAAPEVRSALALAEKNLRWSDFSCGWDLRAPEFGGNGFFDGEVEPCINGGVLAFGSYFGRPSARLAERLLKEQLADGGWNCEAPEKSSVSSFNTRICVLEGLAEYERAAGGSREVAEARKRGGEYLLERSLFRRQSTGETIDPKFLEFAFPPRYRYDVLRALDYFRATGANRDARMEEAVRVIERKRTANGWWLLDAGYDEALTVSTGEAVGDASRWNTLRAMRVLQWYRRSV